MGRRARWLVHGTGEKALNYVCDANVSDCTETDTFREKGIALIDSVGKALEWRLGRLLGMTKGTR